MKTFALPVSFLAAAATIFALSLGFEAAVSVLFAAGLVGILIADYTHLVRPRRFQLAPAIVAERNEAFRLAA